MHLGTGGSDACRITILILGKFLDRTTFIVVDRTPLHCLTNSSLDFERYELAKIFVESGSNIYVEDDSGHTPLWYAVENKDDDCSAYLLTEMTEGSMSEKKPKDLTSEVIFNMLSSSVNEGLDDVADAFFNIISDPAPRMVHIFHESQPASVSPDNYIKMASVTGIPLLSYATNQSYHQLCLELLRRFPDLATVRDESGETSLHKGQCA